MATQVRGKMKRCFGNGPNQALYAAYHDEEWGVPSFDDRHLFEMLILEGAQAGLSWETILKRREGYRELFHQFDPIKIAAMTDQELEELRLNPKIIRNRLKIFSARQNALVFLQIQKEHGSFSNYLWQFVDHKPIQNAFSSFSEVPAHTELSDKVSKSLKIKGMSFVGSTIMYAYLQAVGVVSDHLTTCQCYKR